MSHEQQAGQNDVVWGIEQNPVANLLVFLLVWSVVRSFIKLTTYNDRIIAITL
jgi:hypothetical protein